MEHISTSTPSASPAPEAKAISFPGRRMMWAGLLLITLAALCAVLTPALLIQPFRPQTTRELEISYTLRRWSPILTLVLSAVTFLLVLRLWRTGRGWWRKSLLALFLVLSLASTWLARQNHFEWMFNPLAHTSYARAGEAGFVSDRDMLMTVKVGGEAAAYPIRQMAYHHLVQDVVGGTPVVATY